MYNHFQQKIWSAVYVTLEMVKFKECGLNFEVYD